MTKSARATAGAASTPPRPDRIAGYVERVVRNEIIGWASVEPAPPDGVRLVVLLDGEVIARGVPNRRRNDVIAAGYPDGVHGFRITTPLDLLHVEPSRIEVVVEPWNLPLKRSARGNLRPRTARRGRLDGLRGGAIVGWAFDGEAPDAHQSIEIKVDGRVLATVRADVERLDLVKNGLPRPDLGFRVELPSQNATASEIAVEAFYADGGGALPGSPMTIRVASDARSAFGFVLGAVTEGLIDEEEGAQRIGAILSEGANPAPEVWAWLFEAAGPLGYSMIAAEAARRLVPAGPEVPIAGRAALALVTSDPDLVPRNGLPTWVRDLGRRVEGGEARPEDTAPMAPALRSALIQRAWTGGEADRAARILANDLSTTAGRAIEVAAAPLGPAAQAPVATQRRDDLPASAPRTSSPARGGSTAMAGRQRDEARLQRDQARTQRDRARRQRDEARAERDTFQGRVKSLETAVNSVLEAVKTTAQAVGLEIAPVVTRSEGFSEIDVYRGEQQREEQRPTVRAKQVAGLPLSVKELEVVHDRRVPFLSRRLMTRRTPPKNVAFFTIANDKFLPGLEAMIMSLLEVYPDLESDIYVYSDGTIRDVAQRRLKRFYPNLHFVVPDMGWFEAMPQKSDNHKRIGKLGYMNIYGLTLEQYDRVVLLDSDILILDDISALWEGDEMVVCYDCGDREYVTKSSYTNDYIFNSGVISIAKKHIGPAAFAEMRAIVMDSGREVCPLIDRFADQKAWNIFLMTREKTVAPVNYNCNVKYVVNSLGGRTEGVSIVHFAGPKPWAHKDYVHESLVDVRQSKSVRFDKLWLDHYRRLLYRTRLHQFTGHHDTEMRRKPVRTGRNEPGRDTCFMIGNGPSIQKTDLTILKDYEKFCYNWFILHNDFDAIRPEHLVLASHMFFGGWNTQEPAFPEGYREKMLALKHRPVLWTSFVYREFFESLGLDKEFEVNYLLFEKPFKRFVDRVGVYNADPLAFQDDSRTGVISVGMVAAVAMGFTRIGLVGCDASYNKQKSNSNYFYDEKLHTSLQTRADSLTSTWEDGGRGQYVYRLAYEGLAARGIELVDCTVDGEIQDVPKADLETFRVKKMRKAS